VADVSAVWATIRSLWWLEILALLAATAIHFAAAWPQLVASLPGLSLSQAAITSQASATAANSLPGGGMVAVGVNYSMCRSWGFNDSAIVLSTLTTFVWNMFMKLGLPVIALAILVFAGKGSGGLIVASSAGLALMIAVIVVLAVMNRSQAMAGRIGSRLGRGVSFLRRLIRKPPVSGWGEAAIRFRSEASGLMAARWMPLTGSTLASHLGLYAVLLLSLRFAGVSPGEVSWPQILGVFAVVRLLSAIPITPGGLGIVDLGYVGGLVLVGRHQGEVPVALFHAQVTAAVLVFRTLTYGLQIPIGGLAYAVWVRNKRWRKVDVISAA